MQCPVDGATLTMSERSGIEIDYCPTCRGVWLDRGELDKILERSRQESGGGRRDYDDDRRDDRRYDDRRYDDRHHDRRYDSRYDSKYGKKQRRENWIADLFG